MTAFVAPATSSADAYRRAARRLRCRYAGQPERLQYSLKALADATPAPARDSAGSRNARQFAREQDSSSAPDTPAQLFANYLTEHAPTTLLRYSQRLEMLDAARRLGIGRFEANLLLAAFARQDPSGYAQKTAPQNEGSLLSNLTVFTLVQGAVMLGAWWTVFH